MSPLCEVNGHWMTIYHQTSGIICAAGDRSLVMIIHNGSRLKFPKLGPGIALMSLEKSKRNVV